eukprot:807067_1
MEEALFDLELFVNSLRQIGKMAATQTTKMVCDTLEGINQMHLHKMLHRDIKPQNILIMKGGTVKLTDFNLSKQTRHAHKVTVKTICGTPAYESPQMYNDEPYSSKTDIWSLGAVILFVCIPQYYDILNQWESITWEKRVRRFHKVIDQLPKIPPILRYIFKHCYNMKENERMSASELLDGLKKQKGDMDCGVDCELLDKVKKHDRGSLDKEETIAIQPPLFAIQPRLIQSGCVMYKADDQDTIDGYIIAHLGSWDSIMVYYQDHWYQAEIELVTPESLQLHVSTKPTSDITIHKNSGLILPAQDLTLRYHLRVGSIMRYCIATKEKNNEMDEWHRGTITGITKTGIIFDMEYEVPRFDGIDNPPDIRPFDWVDCNG